MPERAWHAHTLKTPDLNLAWYELGAGPLLIVYGYQDFEPITRAYLPRDRLPHARASLLNECGHHPWLEQPEAFFEQLVRFLHA